MTVAADMTIAPRCTNRDCRKRMGKHHYSPGTHDIRCPACNTQLSISIDAETQELSQCPLCGGREFFIRKDFPQRAGLLMVFLFGIVASILYYQQNIIATFATLFALVIVDTAIYLVVGRVSVCYRCRAEFRNTAYNPRHGGFDLATSEKYE